MPFIADPALRQLLSARPLVHTAERRAMAEALERFYGVRRVRFAQAGAPFDAVANRVKLSSVTLHYCSYAVDTEIEFAAADGFRQFFQISGAGRLRARGREFELSQDMTAIIPPGNFEVSYSGGYSHLVMQLDEGAVRHSAEAFFGKILPSQINIGELTARERTKSVGLSAVLDALAAQFTEGVNINETVIANLEQSLLMNFVAEHAMELAKPENDAAKFGSRGNTKAFEDYIHANWDKVLSVQDIARACGISVRSLYAQFKHEHGVSPAAYMRGVRLDHVNRLLREGDGDVSVLEAAMKSGFASFGHFSQRYRERFGELPSATIRRRGSPR